MRRTKLVLTVIIVIVLAGAVYFLFNGVPWEDAAAGERENGGARAALAGPGGSGAGGGTGTGSGTGAGGGAEAADGSDLWYYDDERAGRYEAYAAKNPGLSVGDVVWMVNVDLDKEPYEDTREVPDPMSLTLLVNKHFYLPEDFTPPDLVYIGKTMLRAAAADAINEMIDAAAEEGHKLWVQSGVRSYAIQADLYAKYSARDGEEAADTYSARPGHSEHQTGLTADLNTITDAFGETPEGIWTAENCWKYGLIIRYTTENTGVTLYKSEPWHVRYIGREAAAGMRDLGMSAFEEYWVKYVNYGSQGR